VVRVPNDIDDHGHDTVGEPGENRPDHAAPLAAAIGQRFGQFQGAIRGQPCQADCDQHCNHRPADSFGLLLDREIAGIEREQ
jgi:hypothetical protein